MTSYHAQSGPGRRRPARAPARRGGSRFGHGRGHAGRQRPGRRACRGLGRGRRHGRADPGCVGRAGGGGRVGRRGAALDVRGVPAAIRARTEGPAGAHRRRRAGRILFEAPGRVAARSGTSPTSCGPDRPAAVCRELTKLHEPIVRGARSASSRRPRRRSHPGARRVRARRRRVDGRRAQAGEGDRAAAMDAARAEVERLVAEGLARDAARRVAAATGLPRRALYGASPDSTPPAGADRYDAPVTASARTGGDADFVASLVGASSATTWHERARCQLELVSPASQPPPLAPTGSASPGPPKNAWSRMRCAESS